MSSAPVTAEPRARATGSTAPAERLWAYGLYGAVLSGAGLPIYIFAPKYYADTYGVSLTALAAVLFVLRLVDVVQDPALGWVSERLGTWRRRATAAGGLVLAAAMLCLFAAPPAFDPVWWFALSLTGLFSAFSFLSITFYAQGVEKARSLPGGHLRLAGWREGGSLLGVCLAAVAPTVLALWLASPYAAFAVGFATVTLLAILAMVPEWTTTSRAGTIEKPVPLRTILGDAVTRRLLILALVNATPLAVSSTLFLYYVESVLQAPGLEGGLLVLFFLSAAASAPLWSWMAGRVGARKVLLGAMILAVLSFAAVPLLGAGDTVPFAVICLISGATIGADLTLLPALFAARMARIAPRGGQGFGLWAFAQKFTLAFAAALLLPALELAGFESRAGADNPDGALRLLTYLYAILPCGLKLLAIGLLVFQPATFEED